MASSLQEWKCSKLTRKCPYQKVKDGKWFFQCDYIIPSNALAGRSITKSNCNRCIIVLAMKRLTYVKKVIKFFDFLKVFKANSIYFI